MAALIARHAPSDAVVVSLQNGVGNLDVLRAHLGASSPSPRTSRGEGRGEGQPQASAQASAPHPSPLPASGERGRSSPAWCPSTSCRRAAKAAAPRFHRATSGTLLIGAGVPGLRDAARRAGRGASPSMPTWTGVLWGKLLLNLNNALNALCRPAAGHRARRPALAAPAGRADRRGARRAEGGGHPPGPRRRRAAARDPVHPAAARLAVPAWWRGACWRSIPQARSSMWEDLALRRPTEIDYLQGAILALAGKAGRGGADHRARRCVSSRARRARAPARRSCVPSRWRRVSELRGSSWGGARWTRTSSSSAAGSRGWSPPCELIEAGRKVILLDQEGEQSLGGQAFWSFGGLFFVDSPEQRRMRIRDFARPGAAGLDGLGRLRPRRGSLAAQVGRGLRRLRGGREARLAACPRRALVSDRRLGRARRLHRHRARQLGAALPRHLGHGARHHRAVRCARARGRQAGARVAALPPSRQRAHQHGRRRRRRAGDILEPSERRARTAELAHGGRRVRAQGAGDHRHVRRHRRQPRPRAPELAEAARRRRPRA